MKIPRLVDIPMKAMRRAVVSAAMAGLALGLTPMSAQAADITVTGTYQNKQTGLCLDSNAEGDVYTSICDPNRKNPYQQWVFTYSGAWANTIVNVATHRCLLPALYYVHASNVYCGAPDYRPTKWIKDGDRRRSAADPTRCLDSNWNYEVYPLTCNGGNYQNWQLNVLSRT